MSLSLMEKVQQLLSTARAAAGESFRKASQPFFSTRQACTVSIICSENISKPGCLEKEYMLHVSSAPADRACNVQSHHVIKDHFLILINQSIDFVFICFGWNIYISYTSILFGLYQSWKTLIL